MKKFYLSLGIMTVVIFPVLFLQGLTLKVQRQDIDRLHMAIRVRDSTIADMQANSIPTCLAAATKAWAEKSAMCYSEPSNSLFKRKRFQQEGAPQYGSAKVATTEFIP